MSGVRSKLKSLFHGSDQQGDDGGSRPEISGPLSPSGGSPGTIRKKIDKSQIDSTPSLASTFTGPDSSTLKSSISLAGSMSVLTDEDLPPGVSPDDVIKRFKEIVMSNVKPEQHAVLEALPIGKKYKLLQSYETKDQKELEPASTFVEKLAQLNKGRKRPQIEPGGYKNWLQSTMDSKGADRTRQASMEVIKGLEVSLRSNLSAWVKEFLDPPNNGLDVLIEYWETMDGQRRADGEEHLAVLCLRAITNTSYGLEFLKSSTVSQNAMNLLMMALINNRPATKAVALELAAPLIPLWGNDPIFRALENLQKLLGAPNPFQELLDMMNSDNPNIEFLTNAFLMLNPLVHNLEDLNRRIYYQESLDIMGLETIMENCESYGELKLKIQIDGYRENCIDVADYMDIGKGGIRIPRGLQADWDNMCRTKDTLEIEVKAAKEKEKAYLSRIAESEVLVAEAEKVKNELEKRIKELESGQHGHPSLLSVPAPPSTSGGPPPPPPPTPAGRGGPPPPPPPGGKAAAPLPPPPGGGPPPPPGGGPPPPPPPGGRGGPPPPPPPGGRGPPPPPGGRGPPGPPRSPGAPGATALPAKKKVAVVSSVPLPTLNWTPIRNIEGTIFKKVDDDTFIEQYNFSEFERTFAMATRSSSSTSLSSESSLSVKKPSKVEKITVLDDKRGRTVGIAMRRVHLKPEDVSKALDTGDIKALDEETCDMLLKVCPTPEEIEALKGVEAQVAMLQETDIFMLGLSKIPRLEKRLMALRAGITLDDNLAATRPQVDAVTTASTSLMKSKKFTKVIEMVLAFGNFMNAKRGGAYGFRLNALNQLADTKSTTDRSMTLVHFLEDEIRTKYRDLVDWPSELLAVDNAAQINLATLQADVNGLDRARRQIEEEVKTLGANAPKAYVEFNEKACKHVQKLVEDFQKMLQIYKDVLKYFAEDEKTELETFFGMVVKFVQTYKNAAADNQRKRDAAKKAQDKEAKNRPPGGIALPGMSMDDRLSKANFQAYDGAIDDVINHLKTGGFKAQIGGGKNMGANRQSRLPASVPAN
eukprot:comp22593_c0_seq1/m.34618 comp22593_c0_seq1/g.34618  ORF comp22593_c0_seq1/g.34618 comp22593_c0_seq1/m.34618 type:complete len:1041 (-) comp22593_c0_seq1:292-3414(-)